MDNLDYAKAAFQQLGSRLFLLTTGAQNLTIINYGFMCQLPRTQHGNSLWLEIVINGGDLWDIKLSRITKSGKKVLQSQNDVFAGDLKREVENLTGLYLWLT